MTRTSWVEICVSDFEQSITWFETVLGFRVVARDANDYVELSRGETFIQLATDDAPYWASERPHLLPSGQWHMRQFWVRHPDGYLIRPAQKLLSVNAATYRRQVADAFRRETPRITQELLAVRETADQLARQGDFLGAATIYETMVMEIFEQSHLYYEEAGYDDYSEEEQYYPEEEGLEELVGEYIEVLGTYLADKQVDRVARDKIIEVLFDIYEHDLHADNGLGFTTSTSDQLITFSTPLERQTIAEWIREILADEDKASVGSERRAYGKFLLDLEKDTLDDEAYLRICRETGRTSDLVDRLLTLGRIDEAAKETQRVDDHAILGLVELFIQHGQDVEAEHLIRARIKENQPLHLLEWLQRYYHATNNYAAELEIVETLFHAQPYLRRYQELRDLAGKLDRWETLRADLLAFLEQSRRSTLLIQIAIDEGDIDHALHLLKGMAKKDSRGITYNDGYGYYGFGDIALEVARVAEETRPHEAIELYRRSAERLIALRDRRNYQAACQYLVKMRELYKKIGEHEAWTSYVTTLREQNRNLRALKEELVKAGL